MACGTDRVRLEETEAKNCPSFNLAITTAMDPQNLFYKKNGFRDCSSRFNPSVASMGQRVHEVLQTVCKGVGHPYTPGTGAKCHIYCPYKDLLLGPPQ